MTGRAQGSTANWLGYLALVVALVQALGPLAWIVAGSLKSSAEFYANPWGLPSNPRFANYAAAVVQAGVADGLWNSLTVVLMGVGLLAVTAGPMAYALARYRFRGKAVIIGLILFTMIVPPDVLTVPLFVTLRQLGLLGGLPGLACLYASGAFGMSVFLLRAYFEAIPFAIEEAARLDGASMFVTLSRIVVPLALPGFASVMAIQAMGMWNDLYLALVFIPDPDFATAPVGLLSFFQRDTINWPLLLSGLCALTMPVLILFALLQRRFVEGLVGGGVK
jgi:ABC-type glycerol-3-phosphate transport system permease component